MHRFQKKFDRYHGRNFKLKVGDVGGGEGGG